MDRVERWWKASLAQTPETGTAEPVLALAEACLAFQDLPWATRLMGVAGLVHQMVGPQTGISVYVVSQPETRLAVVAGAGITGPLTVAWRAPLAGMAASEGAVQFLGDPRALPDYLGGWVGVTQAVAVPLVRQQRLAAVFEVRWHRPDASVGLVEIERIQAIAGLVANQWPY
jgi:hypothetical protein